MMTYRRMALSAAIGIAAACTGRGDSVVDDSGSVSRDTAAATCGVGADTRLTGDGIGDLRVGTPVEQVTRGCRVVRDTVVRGAEGTQERRLLVDLGGDIVFAVVDSSRVWRIHVNTPAFRTSDSLGVGTPASELRRPGARLLAGEGAMYVTLPSHCGLSFRLRGVEFGRPSSMSDVPSSATVNEVLAIGCSR